MQEYAEYEEDKLRQLIHFEEDAVELDLPAAVGHWKILPLTHPKVLTFNGTSVLWVQGKLEFQEAYVCMCT